MPYETPKTIRNYMYRFSHHHLANSPHECEFRIKLMCLYICHCLEGFLAKSLTKNIQKVFLNVRLYWLNICSPSMAYDLTRFSYLAAGCLKT